MKLHYNFNQDATIRDVELVGCSGLERVSNTKEAVYILQLENPIIGFTEAIRRGAYTEKSDEEYDQLLASIQCLASLFRYPDDPPDAKNRCQMNVLTLLTNAITKLVEQDVALRRHLEAATL